MRHQIGVQLVHPPPTAKKTAHADIGPCETENNISEKTRKSALVTNLISNARMKQKNIAYTKISTEMDHIGPLKEYPS